MAVRTVVLVDDTEKRVGSTKVPDTVFIIEHGGEHYVRTEKGVRLSGGGIGVVFLLTEPWRRDRLDP